MSELQARLKEETASLHSESEQHPLMQSFVDGSFKKEHLLELLINLLPVYQVVEQRLLIKEIIDNPDLKRSVQFQKDIDKLILDTGITTLKVKKITENWVSSSWKKDLHLLKADLYIRWLADFYGGRILAKSQAPYNEMYSSKDPGAVITTVRYLLTKDIPDNQNDNIVNETKAFFKFHIELFDEILWSKPLI
jgi:heme oxygenase